MDGSNVAIGNADVHQTMNAPTIISRDRLMRDLSEAGLSPAQLAALSDALERDGEVEDKPGPAVTSWFQEIRAQITATVVPTIWALVCTYLGVSAAS
ncbi:hypothetical protein IU436_28965 [Nocardia farcinica]|uniref:hypothetical protein n=1 Tax=Nocardia TaxID=1817 RepID=UPI001894FF90|nr:MULTISPECIES: hypothetical protein [Nocardia]MBF6216124.1 hypothetical protein [Nocardia puris]MBF6422669.1 hypothetical protein [Nocardia farcinica]MBF6434359.1 hypothetical protein [Nocardia farcinica]MBF6505444.1 hypothetical protein [Nocardia farcinica]